MTMNNRILKIGDRLVGEDQPCFILAEAGVNHNGHLGMALKLVDVAVEAGADAVKFQKRELKNLYPTDLLDDPNSAEWAFQYMLPILKQTELTDDEFRKIKDYCDERGIRFMCTPWDEDSLRFLEEFDLDAYKVSSADLVNIPLLAKLVETGKPLILSVGMATLKEIEHTVQFLKGKDASFALLHCVSTYPAPFESLNLRFIKTLQSFDVPVGYSSHERGIAIPLVALTLGASIIEKHITLDRTLPGPDHPASLEPAGIKKLVRDIRNVELALGNNEKYITTMEMLNRQVLRKSLVATRFLPKGTVITPDMVTVKGPGKGLSPQLIDELIGARLDRDVKVEGYFVEGDLKSGTGSQIQVEKIHGTWGLKSRFHDLQEILAKKPKLVELHFSEEDIDYPFSPPDQLYEQQLFIHAPEFADRKLLNLCSPDDVVFERAIQLLQRTIDKAVELRPYFSGSVGIVIHVGGMSMDEPIVNPRDRERLLQRSIEGFRRLDPKGTILLPENLPPRPWYLGGQWHQNIFIRPEEMIEFAQELGVGITLDTSHAQLYCNVYKQDLVDFVKQCLPYTRHMHFGDASGIDGEGLQIGEGVVDWDVLLPLLADEEFSWVPEIWSGHLQDGAGFIEAVNRLARYGVL